MSESRLMLDWITRKRREWDNTVTDLEFEEWVKKEEAMYNEGCEAFIPPQQVVSVSPSSKQYNDLQAAFGTIVNAINAVNESKCGIEIDANGHGLTAVVRRGDASVDFTATIKMGEPVRMSPTILKGVLREANRCIEEASEVLQTMTGVRLNAEKTLSAIREAVNALDEGR